MRENSHRVRQILQYFSGPNVGDPANVTVEDLAEVFPHVDRQDLEYQVKCAIRKGFLRAPINKSTLLDGVIETVGHISGITDLGRRYLRIPLMTAS